MERVLVYGSETWPMKSEDLLRLERAERMMWRWMCGVKLEDRRPSRPTELSKCLDVEPVADVVRRGRLRWFGHVQRKSGNDWVSTSRGFVVGSIRVLHSGGLPFRETAYF